MQDPEVNKSGQCKSQLLERIRTVGPSSKFSDTLGTLTLQGNKWEGWKKLSPDPFMLIKSSNNMIKEHRLTRSTKENAKVFCDVCFSIPQDKLR